MKTVLLIGARGFLGSKVLDAILAKNKSEKKYLVKVLIRPTSNASKLEALENVEVVRGDMMDPESLQAAMGKDSNVEIVVSTANGYMQGHPEIDTVGCNHVADAVKANSATIKRYIYCSVLTADKAVNVEHFYDKFKAEEYMRELELPFIALRPGAFLDQATDYLGDGIKRGDSMALSMWDKTVPIGMIYTPDLAEYFANAMELPDEALGMSIDVGWSRPVTYQEVVAMCASKLDKKMYCLALPWLLRTTVIYTAGLVSGFVAELMRMFNYFGTGQYVNNVELQTKYLGDPPTPEEVVGRYVDKLLEEKQAAQASTE